MIKVHMYIFLTGSLILGQSTLRTELIIRYDKSIFGGRLEH